MPAPSVDARRPKGDAGDAWTLTYGRRAPRTVVVVLTDVDRTEVECPLPRAADEGLSHVGVFLLDGVLHCMERGSKGS